MVRGFNVAILENIATTSSGGTPSRGNIDFYKGDIPWITTGELRDDYIFDSKEHITQEALDNSSAKVFPAGTVLMAMYGATIGRLGILQLDAATNQACCAFFPNPNKLNARYLYNWLFYHRNELIEMGTGAGQPNISQNIIKKLEIDLPEIEEQNNIVEVLSDIDKLISTQEALIDKKQAMKQGAMQVLLTGKQRVNGFTGKWVAKKLKDIAPLQRGFDLPVSSIVDGKFPVVFSNGINAWHNRFMVKGPGVVMGRSGTIGKISYVDEDYWPHNTSLWVTDFCGNYPKYVYYLFQTLTWDMYMSGSGVPTLNRNDVHECELIIPADLDEQVVIARILEDMDNEVTIQQINLEKIKRIKSGMMDNLLTGRIRLID